MEKREKGREGRGEGVVCLCLIMCMQPVGYIMRRPAAIGIALQEPSEILCPSIAGGPSSGRESIRFDSGETANGCPPVSKQPLQEETHTKPGAWQVPPGATSKETDETHRSAVAPFYTAKTSLVRTPAS